MSKKPAPHPSDIKVAALAVAKNEGPWLIEWAAHCKAVGFDTIVLGTNDCDDGTDEIADFLAEMGVISHFDNQPPYYILNYLDTPSLQLTAYDRMQSMPEVKACDWVMPMDLDEFLVVHVGDGSVQELCAKHYQTSGVIIRWRMFGDSGHSGMIDPPISDILTRCATKTDENNENVKMLVRDHQEVELAMHISVRRYIGPMAGKWKQALRNARGLREHAYVNFDDQLYKVQRAHGPKALLGHFGDRGFEYKDAQVNHYAIRTPEICRLKSVRGDAYYAQTNRFQQDYIEKFNRNEEEDTSIFKYREKRDAYLKEWLSNPRLKELHDRSIQITKDKLAKMDAEGFKMTEATEKNAKLTWWERRKLKRMHRR